MIAFPPLHQVFVTVVTTMAAYYAMDVNIGDDLISIVGPTIMTGVLAYFTGKMVVAVYGMAITTILQCFVADEEIFPAGQQCADQELKGWVDRHGAPVKVSAGPGKDPYPVSARQYSSS